MHRERLAALVAALSIVVGIVAPWAALVAALVLVCAGLTVLTLGTRPASHAVERRRMQNPR